MLIDSSQSIRESQTLAMAAIAQIEGVLDEPAPAWTVVEFGAAGIQLRFYGWVDQRETDLGKVRSEAIRRVKSAFADAGIEAPRTTYHIVTSRQRDAQEIDAMIEPETARTFRSIATSMYRSRRRAKATPGRTCCSRSRPRADRRPLCRNLRTVTRFDTTEWIGRSS